MLALGNQSLKKGAPTTDLKQTSLGFCFYLITATYTNPGLPGGNGNPRNTADYLYNVPSGQKQLDADATENAYKTTHV